MAEKGDILVEVLRHLRSDPRIGPHFKPALLDIDAQGAVTIEAEVQDVAAKRRGLERIAGTPGVSGVIEGLRVRPASPMSDDGIRDHLRKAYYEEPEFRRLRIKERVMGEARLVRDALPEAAGELEIGVADGVVTLNGAVPGLASKRLAGVLAWWVPGSRDVINGIAVEPPEEDGPIRIEEAVRIALDKDPLVDASQMRVGVRDRTVHLTGVAASPAIRDAAEWDAWYVFGVDDVVNDIAVRA